MEQNHENSFWRSNVKMVPGRASPTSVKPKIAGNSSTSQFEKYQKSVSDAWTLSEDELTKEYCILSDETKMSRRTRTYKNPIAVVHRQSSSSSSALSSIQTNSATTSLTANRSSEPTIYEEEDQKETQPKKPEQRKVSTEYG